MDLSFNLRSEAALNSKARLEALRTKVLGSVKTGVFVTDENIDRALDERAAILGFLVASVSE